MKETINLIEKNTEDDDFKNLEAELNDELLSRYGDVQQQYMLHDSLHTDAFVIVAYSGSVAIGCGALQKRDDVRGEVKRMYVKPQFRNKNVAGLILQKIEAKATEYNLRHLLLETGIRQPESIALYDKFQYSHIESFRPGDDIQESIFFGKQLCCLA